MTLNRARELFPLEVSRTQSLSICVHVNIIYLFIQESEEIPQFEAQGTEAETSFDHSTTTDKSPAEAGEEFRSVPDPTEGGLDNIDERPNVPLDLSESSISHTDLD